MNILERVEQVIVAALLGGGATSWPIFKGFLPDTSNQSIGIFDSPGQTPVNQATDVSFYPGFQIRVRGDVRDYEAARSKIMELRDLLHDSSLVGITYCFANQSLPTPLGNDGEDRPNLVMNFRTMEVV